MKRDDAASRVTSCWCSALAHWSRHRTHSRFAWLADNPRHIITTGRAWHDGASAEAARAAVNAIANPTMPEVGERYLGTVVKTTNFGAFVSLMPGKDGLLHITKLKALNGGKRIESVEDVVEVGQKIQVEIVEIDDRGKLSLAPVVEDEGAEAPAETAAAAEGGDSEE